MFRRAPIPLVALPAVVVVGIIAVVTAELAAGPIRADRESAFTAQPPGAPTDFLVGKAGDEGVKHRGAHSLWPTRVKG